MRFRITEAHGWATVEMDFLSEQEARREAKKWGWSISKVERINPNTGEVIKKAKDIKEVGVKGGGESARGN